MADGWTMIDGEFLDIVCQLGLDSYAHETHTEPNHIRLTLWDDDSWDGTGEFPPIYAQVVITVAEDMAFRVEAQADPRADGMLLARMLWVACDIGQRHGFPAPDWDY